MVKEAEEVKVRIQVTAGRVLVDNLNKTKKGVSAMNVDEGYIVVGAHVDESTTQKIIKGEYVDFAKLVPRDRVVAEKDGRLEMVFRNGRTYWVPVRDPVVISSFGKWQQAFRVFVNIYCKANPQRAVELIEYNHVIHTASTTYIWDNVYLYDKEFRLHMARNPQRSWSIILQ